ncbi:MAG: NAD-dependent epimerase/dehydratase family protein [Patescibacteria group bacterium]
MLSALIGYSGFIGGNLIKQTRFDDLYNSKNIADIKGKKYDLIVSAGTSSLRWKADLEPDADWQNIQKLINYIKEVEAGHFILISTVDVYPKPFAVDEDTANAGKKQKGYGLNRYKLEMFIRKKFKSSTCVRLPQTFGPGLKKNFIFDLIYNNRLDFTHKDSLFQWYNLKNLWKDISIARDNNIPIVNFAVEPLSTREVAKYTLDKAFATITDKPHLHYDMWTKYGSLYNSHDHYIYHRLETLEELRVFIEEAKQKI